jgi:hypothetical protein
LQCTFGDFEIASANAGAVPIGMELSFAVSVCASITGRIVSSFSTEMAFDLKVLAG